jgi:iron complex outermembrane recepter protein
MRKSKSKAKTLLAALALATVGASAIPCRATDNGVTYHLDIPAQSLHDALQALALASRHRLLYSSKLVHGKRSSSVRGELTTEEAIRQLLSGTDLTYEVTSDGLVMIKDPNNAAPLSMSDEQKMDAVHLAHADAASGTVTNEAQEADAESADGARLEEVVVTAQKRVETLQEVPISIAVLSGEAIDSRGINDLQDLSYSVPGLFVNETGFERRVSIRGIGNVFGSSSTIGTYVDEAVAVGPRGDHALDFQTYDLARVEVLRGPQGTLYGQGSMGGTIRYITADPDLTRVIGVTDLDASFTEDGDPNERLRGALSLPLARDKLGVRVAGVYENVGGWVDQPALSKRDINDRELVNVRTKGLWRPTEAVDITAMAIIHRDDRGALGIGTDERGNYEQPLLDPSTPSGSVDYELYNFTLSYELPGVRLLGTSTYLNYDSEMRHYGQECCALDPHLDGQYTVDRWVFTGDTLTQELRLISSGSGRLTWTLGGIYQDNESIDDYGPASGNLIGVPGGTLDVDVFNWTVFANESSRSWAAFGETSFALVDRLNIGVGLRYFEDDRRLQTQPGGAFQSGTFQSTNPRVFLDYAPRDYLNIYASIAKGFRSGGFNGADQPPYEPEELLSYELGTKMSLLNRHLYVELALTHSDYSDYQVIGQIPGGFENITANAGDARIRGIDGSVAWRPTNDWELGLTASYVDAEFTEINASPSSHSVGDPVDMVPEYGASMWAEYQFDWSGGGDNPGFARVDFSQQGIAHFRNRIFADTYHSTSDVLSLLNARLGWARERWTTELYAQNLLNENGFDSNAAIERAATRVWPRSYGIRVGVRFD